jgi:hypothetical protein
MIMVTQSYFKVIPVLLSLILSHQLVAQVFPAKDGSFIVFHSTPDKSAKVNIDEEGIKNKTYEWPANANQFTNAYREAEKLIPGPDILTDEQLQKIWEELEKMEAFSPSYQFHPTMLLALGQAELMMENKTLSSVKISIRRAGNDPVTKTLAFRNHTLSTSNVGAEHAEGEGKNIDLKFVFPYDSWVKSATVYKKVVGSTDSMKILPLLFTTSLSDRIEMNIRDTADVIGEFLYTIRPHDHLGNAHALLQPVYASNYNQLSAPAIVNFRSNAIKDSKIIQLGWDCTVRERVRGFEIYRGMESYGPFIKLASLPATDSVFVDQVEGVMRNFFYFVQIIDQFGPGQRSIIRFVNALDNEKPAPPFDLVSEPMIQGVKLQWPVMDGLHHVRGYYVFRLDSDNITWTQVSEFIPRSGSVMTFIDSTSNLEAHHTYTYAVRSESTSYQLSEFSTKTMCRPGKPRNVATPEDFSFRYMDDGKLMLYWSDQQSVDPYVSKYHIYATDQNGKSPVEVKGSPFDITQNFWIVDEGTAIAPGYIIRSADAWNNLSAPSRMVSPMEDKKMLSPGFILVHPSKTGHRLSWGLPESPDVKSIQLYEQAEDGKSTLVQSLKPTVGQYDLAVSTKSNARIFYLKWKLSNGTETDPGEAVVISK